MVSRSARVHVLSEALSALSVTPSANTVAAAAEIWREAVRAAPASMTGTILGDLVSANLRAGLERWVGLHGCRSLLERAVRVVAGRHPVLRQLPSLAAGADAAEQVKSSARAVAAGMTALLAMVIELLGHLIGAEIAVSLVRQSVGPSARGVASQSSASRQ